MLIRTERLLLRPFTATDVDDVWSYQREPAVARFMRWEPRDRAEVVAVVDQMAGEITLAAEGDCLSLAVVEASGGRVIGHVELVWVSRADSTGEIGFILDPRYQGRGLAAEAAREMLRLGFEHFGLRRIIGRCAGGNTASAALLRRLGLRQEAHFVQSRLRKGVWEDELVFAVLRTDND
ncbi:GNAT family N-acetyltransferase [Actinoplanes awajinensis]|uniref:Acetyltransferase n=1 Tax=Actinoplanes awajinensis subsp. mycoplanecinus TaxID=135947 RepID=A0A124G9E4_9ACTN|nr:GNAT family protein [Actinoplanes awajinensis]KUL28837.1 acetyltransferase [Actinoplanes awajinensis subsp. mycoplanecinus]